MKKPFHLSKCWYFFISLFSISIFILLISNPVLANPDNWNDYVNLESSLGSKISILKVKTDDSKKVFNVLLIQGDQKKYISEIDKLKKYNILNNNEDNFWFASRPNIVSNIMLLQAASTAVGNYFLMQSHKDPVFVMANIILHDKYGHVIQKDYFTFIFTREISQNVDWNHFELQNLRKIAIKFSYSKWALAAIFREANNHP